MTVPEQHPSLKPRSHHKGATSIQMHLAARQGLNWQPTASSSMSLSLRTRTRHLLLCPHSENPFMDHHHLWKCPYADPGRDQMSSPKKLPLVYISWQILQVHQE